MDFDLHFGGFLAPKSRFFESLSVQKCVSPGNSEFQKNVIFLRENAIFYKTDVFFFEVEIDEKHEKTRKNWLWSHVVFQHRFWRDFGAKLGPFCLPCWAPTNMFHLGFFARRVQEAPKSPKSAPREPQESPKSAPRVFKSVQECPKSAQEGPKSNQNYRKSLQVARNRWKSAEIA